MRMEPGRGTTVCSDSALPRPPRRDAPGQRGAQPLVQGAVSGSSPERAAHLLSIALLILLPACSTTPPRPTTPPPALANGIAWLVAQQAPEGAWRSTTYSAYGEGPILTAAALWALTACPEGSVPRDAIDRGEAYLRRCIAAEGKLESISPVYGTSLAILSLARLRGPDDVDVRRMARWLVSVQLAEPMGWSRADRAYGGWDRQGDWARSPNLAQADLSILSFAVEALAAARVSEEDPVWDRALTFVSRCQQPDGGFLATPVPEHGWVNKAGEGRSYGTATCDGVRALLACGAPAEACGAWLDAHPSTDAPAGLNAEWTEGLRFYHAYVWAAARRLRGLPVDVSWLAGRQRADGSWANPQPLMKEDDPLVATLLAVAALAEQASAANTR